jgi:phosphopantetheinyl transferase
MATMQRFLQVQQHYEESENQRLAQYLQLQEQAMTAFLGAGGNEARPNPLATNGNHSGAAAERPRPELPQPRPTLPEIPPARYPFIDEIVTIKPGQELEARLTLDLDRHPFLPDHSFIKVPDSIKPAEERLPILPMTFGLEVLGEAAALLAPGWQVVGYHNVEASRWIALESSRTLALTIKARRRSDTVIEAELHTPDKDKPALRGRVDLAPSLAPPQAPRDVPADQPCPHKAEELYSIPLLSHGPRFAVITRLLGMTDSTIVGEMTLRSPAELFTDPPPGSTLIDPVLLDGVGQLMGYKLLLEEWRIYPLRLGKLTRHGPTPPPGSKVRVVIRFRKLDGRFAEMDADVIGPDGKVWLRIEKWKTWRLLWTQKLAEFARHPRNHSVCVPWPVHNADAVCARLQPSVFGEINADWVARYCLVGQEWETYRRQPRFDWLLGRIAIKDAVRDWYLKQLGTHLLHLEIEIGNHPSGAPYLVRPQVEGLALSISHLEDDAFGLAAMARGVGIDVAKIEERGPELWQTAFNDEEQSILDAAEGESLAWLHRGWCAKEALAKAHGLGLEGLKRFRIRRVLPSGIMELAADGEADLFTVATHLEDNRAIAAVTL